jgi:hypothetical protein
MSDGLIGQSRSLAPKDLLCILRKGRVIKLYAVQDFHGLDKPKTKKEERKKNEVWHAWTTRDVVWGSIAYRQSNMVGHSMKCDAFVLRIVAVAVGNARSMDAVSGGVYHP